VQLFIRNVTPDVIARLKRQAEARAVSLETYLHGVLAEAARPSIEEQLVRLHRVHGLAAPGEPVRSAEPV
jgi:hypothetical protein